MSGLTDNRPYRDHSQAEIMQEIRRLESYYRLYRKNYDKASNLGDNGGMDGAQLNMDVTSREIGAYQDELKIRREERAAHRKEREYRGSSAEGKVNLVAVACSCRPPRRFRLPGRVYDLGPITCGNCSQPFKLT